MQCQLQQDGLVGTPRRRPRLLRFHIKASVHLCNTREMSTALLSKCYIGWPILTFMFMRRRVLAHAVVTLEVNPQRTSLKLLFLLQTSKHCAATDHLYVDCDVVGNVI